MRPDRSFWICAALLFAAGFALAWRSSPEAPRPAARAAPIDRPAPAIRPDARPARLAHPASVVPESSPTEVRRSHLPEWGRFRYDHPRLAFSTEVAVRATLDHPVALRDIVATCAPNQRVAPLAISAELELRGREATVRGWGCDAPGASAALCDCVVRHLPDEAHTLLPPDLPDEELAPYEGLLSIDV